MRFEKEYSTPEELIEIMRNRGMTIDDPEHAKHWLEKVGYYRLTGYALRFRIISNRGERLETFREGTHFGKLTEFYEFDRRLRLVLLSAIERFEVAFRTQFCNSMAEAYHSPHWFTDPQLFITSSETPRSGFDHAEFLQSIAKAKDTVFLKHYRSCYSDPIYPPCWMLAEILTLGTWSKLYGALRYNQDKKRIADRFYLTVPEMVSFCHAITTLRNGCAHHNRIWDNTVSISPGTKGVLKGLAPKAQSLFTIILALSYCFYSTADISNWEDTLKQLLAERSPDEKRTMGFPEDGETRIARLRERYCENLELLKRIPSMHSPLPPPKTGFNSTS